MVTNAGHAGTTITTGWDLRGLSTDTKPTGDEVPNGSTFLEMDTGNVYAFDKANTQWRQL
ncbi:MAG: hypothetical protein IJO45_06975 [Oscillospiraceae bacterium]|nr:hypothetical protein [Oscillospiraceae bacterium]